MHFLPSGCFVGGWRASLREVSKQRIRTLVIRNLKCQGWSTAKGCWRLVNLILGVGQEYGWTECSREDLARLSEQMGRTPQGVLAVARRCRYGTPQVIVNDPLPVIRGARRPFPTLFWLTCPYLVRAVGALEAQGWIGTMRQRLSESPSAARAMQRAHRAHAALRLRVGDPAELEGLRRRAPRQYAVLAETGVAGMRAVDGVKCLHTHLADYLGRGAQVRAREGEAVNVIGAWTAQLLAERGVDLAGSPDCPGCRGDGEGDHGHQGQCHD